MRKLLCLILITAAACGGKLSEEERKKLHEGMATQDIRRVTDAEIQEAALALGKAVMTDVVRVDKNLNQHTRIDSLAAARHVKIYSLVPDGAALIEIEKKLVEAYIAGTDTGSSIDNLQFLQDDSLLFTRPVFRFHPDGSQEFSHAIGIKMAKKDVVLSIPQP
ncbi:MAG: hypothetical protein K2U26_16160 [Cyclobacteriaceae bacterium]|nr:hypothetical protein [Cyclobacteriaceae bacterium]